MATYATEQQRVSDGRMARLFIMPETTFGTLVEPTTNDLVLRIDSGIPKQGYKFEEDKQKRYTRTKLAPVKTKTEVGKFSFTIYAKPSGTPNTEPECSDILTALYGNAPLKATGTGTTVSSSTTTLIKGTSGDGAKFVKGQIVVIDVSATTVPQYEQTIITDITTDDFTVAPALAAAPAASKTLYGLCTWVPANTAGSVSIWVEMGDIASATGSLKALAGCKVESIKSAVNGDGTLVEYTFDVSYQTEYRCGRDQCAVQVLIADSSMTLHDASKFSENMYVYMESEVIKITSINYSTNVCAISRAQKATSAAAHAVEIVCYPWLPAGVEVGAPVSGYLGKVRIGSGEMDVISGDWTMNQKPSWQENTKNNSAVPQEGQYPDAREFSLNLKAYATQGNQKFDRISEQATAQWAMLPAGNTPGSMVVAYFSNFNIQNPDISGDGDQEIAITGNVYGTSAGNDEHRLGMC